MYCNRLTGTFGIAGRALSRKHGFFPAARFSATPGHPTKPGMKGVSWVQRRQAYEMSSEAAQQAQAGPGDGGKDKNGRKVRRTDEETEKVKAHKAAMLEYKHKMTALRKEVQQETKERRHAEAVSAALERRRIAKKKKAVMAVKRERAAVSIALNEEKQAKQKATYEAGFREAALIFHEREQRKVNIHAILLEELEEESKHWVTTAEDITTKVTDDIWEVPGNNSAGGQLSMPDDHLWRFSVDIGIYDQEEEPSERNAYLRAKMVSRMQDMKHAETYIKDRHTRWDNDTRGMLKEADRLLRKRSPAPPGYTGRAEHK